MARIATMTECTVIGCSNRTKARGLCMRHYKRWRRHGDPLKGRINHGEAFRFLNECVFPYEGDDCFIWPYGKMSTGYGHVSVGGISTLVHRLACIEENGPPPTEKHEAAHTCGNGAAGCVNKKHVRWATHAENMRDKWAHGTSLDGEKNHRAKLSEKNALKIFRANGNVQRADLAQKYSVSISTIQAIQTGKRWRWLTLGRYCEKQDA